MNELNFRIKVKRDYLVITLIKKKSLRAIDSRIRNLVSDIKTISAEGAKIFLMLIIFKINILNK